MILTAGQFDGGNTTTNNASGGYTEFNFRNTAGDVNFANNVTVVGTGFTTFNMLGNNAKMGTLTAGAGQEIGVYRSSGALTTLSFTGVSLSGSPTFSPKPNTFGAAGQVGGNLELGPITETGVGNYTVTMNGGNTLYLAGTNSFGALVINTSATGTVQVGGATDQSNGTLGLGAVTNNAKLVFNRSNLYTANNAIGGTGSVTKLGAGTLVLGGTNNYQGTTTVTTGTLRVNGTHTGGAAYSVASGATLAGTGSIGSAVTVTGTLAPGASAGTLTIDNKTLTLNSASTLDMELVGNDTTEGGGINDLVAVTNTLGNLSLDGTLNVTEIGGNNFININTPMAWTLITYGGTLTDNGLVPGTMPTLPSGWVYGIDTTSTAGKVLLTVTSVPEANAFLAFGLVAIGTGAAKFVRRRRGQRTAGEVVA